MKYSTILQLNGHSGFTIVRSRTSATHYSLNFHLRTVLSISISIYILFVLLVKTVQDVCVYNYVDECKYGLPKHTKEIINNFKSMATVVILLAD